MFQQILVVCIGNICRSPVAEGLLRQGLMGKNDTRVQSAGISALVGRPAEAPSVQLACARGVDISSHRARQLTPAMLVEADLVLVMEQEHKRAVIELSPSARGKTMLLGHWHGGEEIPDPFRQSFEMFEHTVELIDANTRVWLDHL